MKKLILYSSLFFAAISAKAQTVDTAILWENSIGGTSDDYGYYVEATSDGGYITVGSVSSADGDLAANYGSYDVLLSKLDALGNIVWVKNLGGSLGEEGYTVHQTLDGGYFITGYTNSNDFQVSSNSGFKDIWVVKTNALGTIQWEKTYGGSADERAYTTSQTSDGGYILCGHTESNDGDVTLNNGVSDVWVVKIDTAGIIQWQKSYGGTNGDYGSHISQTPDGGYIITAYSYSNDVDATVNYGGADLWIIKTNTLGVIQWQKNYGGTNEDYSTCGYSTSDGGYIFLAYTASNDGDITFSHGNFDNWLVKLNSAGVIQWQKCLGGTDSDANYALKKTLDGKYILAGYSYSNDFDVSGNHGGGQADYWVAKIDTTGTIEWQTCIGGTGDDEAFSITQIADSSFVVAGISDSNNGDVTGNAGTYDSWVVHLGPAPIILDVNSGTTTSNQILVYPNPSKGDFYFKNLTLETLIEIYDISGKSVLQMTASSTSEKINLKEQSKGIYFYRIISKTEVSVGKIIIE